MDPTMILGAVGVLVILGGLAAFVLFKKRTAYLGPVKEELQKEKMWLRRGEYNAAMVKGRQNLELLLRLVAEKNGIQLDNSVKAQADAKEEMERQNQKSARGKGGRGKKYMPTVMTYQQFGHWLSVNGYLDRVARWEMNQVRIIGNKAAHENYADKDEAWNQLNYLEDILKTVTEKSQNPKKRQEQSKRNDSTEKHVKVNRKKRGGAGEKPQGKNEKQKDQKTPEKSAKQRKAENAPEKPAKQRKAQNALEKSAKQGKAQNAPEKPAKQKKAENVPEKSAKQGKVQNALEKPVKQSKPENAEVEKPEEAAKKKRRRRRRKSGQKPEAESVMNAVPEVPTMEEIPEVKAVKAVKAAKAVKAVKAVKGEAAAEIMADPEGAKKKSKRRRRRKKTNQAQNTPTVTDGMEPVKTSAEAPETKPSEKKLPSEKKPPVQKKPLSEKKPSAQESSDTENKTAEHKRRRRRRKSKRPQNLTVSEANTDAGANANTGHSSGESI